MPRTPTRGVTVAPPGGGAKPAEANGSYPWDRFDPRWYFHQNYAELRDDDLEILRTVRDYFSAVLDPERPVERGVDVGAGSNLYPALTMVPFCRELTLLERGAANVAWLQEQRKGYSSVWDAYWQVLSEKPAYDRISDPREALLHKGRVEQGDLYQLPERRWDLATMFFVAESISDQVSEFKMAVGRFIGALRPGAPFAAAFMHDSAGYYVDRLRFPAVAVNEVDIAETLAPLVEDLDIRAIRSHKPLRDGYAGMIVALGKAGRTRA
ncbi:SCO2525 family SAM-dependent methyltransferase [Rhizomonospora bruguierae]|uniref:SCO2525 family SAM-dependent methyltransferase n=1 Tax=Rhizomonospora bruguierae TaxID=1581705 RepID=UPI001BCFF0C7|nr:SCO2525 family SAM-dependent methyltransferase [Micromonospora sp. NBRC 107566]